MREVLLERVRPLLERLANDLTELAARRIEAELERMGEAFEVALSSYASDRPQVVAAGPSVLDEMLASLEAKPSADAQAPAKRQRDAKPENYPPSRRAREERTEPQANGKKPVTCSKCGYVGGNARGCGRSHPTVTGSGADHAPVRAVPARLPTSPPPDRLAMIAARAAKPPESPRSQAVEHDRDDRPDIYEDSEPLGDRIARAEANKREGELPRPVASFELEHLGGKYAVARELLPEAELDFGGQG